MIASRLRLLFGCAVLTTVSMSQAASISLVPVSASGAHTISGNEIFLQGGGQTVVLEIKLSGWAPNLLSTFQGTIDSTGYTSGTMGSLTSRVLACADNATCDSNMGPGSQCLMRCVGGANDGLNCSNSANCPGGSCDFTICAAGFQDLTRPDWVFSGSIAIAAVNAAVPNFAFGATILGPAIADPGTATYGGTLVLDVSPNAAGTFTVDFSLAIGETFFFDQNSVEIPFTNTPALITIQCQSAADCNDNNACTSDTCNQQNVCINAPNFDANQFCCNPNNGALAALSDGNECTSDMCDAGTGVVTHPNESLGTACGDQSNAQCDLPDTCDGAGSCQSNLLPFGAACGSPTNTDCNLADTCDGAGVCLTNIQPANTPCGDPSTGPCNNPDTCNGLGNCLVNEAANGTPCDDGLFCTQGTACSSGACTGGTPTDCADLLTCTTDTCNEGTDQCDHSLDPNQCLIAGVCQPEGVLNPVNTCEICDSATDPNNWTVLADTTACNDGDACTGTGRPGIGIDTCTGGVCSGTLDPECNDQCDFAVTAIEGANFSNNASTGPDDGEASCQIDSNGDIWFKYTAVCDGLIFLSTTGSALLSLNDPVLTVFDNCPGNGGMEVACDDDGGLDLNAALTFSATSATTYFIRVAGFQNNVGDIVLNLRPFDDCLIDGVCYQLNELNPANACQACLPDLSTTQWSNVPEGIACGDATDTDCDSPDACNGLGVCEVNFKPDGILCTDEIPANICTNDVCAGGACTHPPVAAGLACGDPTDTDCDNPDTCDGGGSCVPNFEDAGFACGDQSTGECDNPNICDATGMCLENLKPDGTPCDDFDVCTDNETCAAGVCVGVPIPLAPLVVGAGPLGLNVTPQPPASAAPVALHLTSPRWPCVDRFINTNGMLTNTPVFQLPSDWGTVFVHGPEIFPSALNDPSDYEVVAECGAFASPPGAGATWRWGDLNDDGSVDFVDVTLEVDVWKAAVSFNDVDPLYDLAPCPPDGHISFADITVEVDAFTGGSYPCPAPCP